MSYERVFYPKSFGTIFVWYVFTLGYRRGYGATDTVPGYHCKFANFVSRLPLILFCVILSVSLYCALRIPVYCRPISVRNCGYFDILRGQKSHCESFTPIGRLPSIAPLRQACFFVKTPLDI